MHPKQTIEHSFQFPDKLLEACYGDANITASQMQEFYRLDNKLTRDIAGAMKDVLYRSLCRLAQDMENNR